MPYWEMLGRKVIARDSRENIEELCSKLVYAGIDACMAKDSVMTADGDTLYSLAVPADECEAAFRYMTPDDADRSKKISEYISNISHSPVFLKSEERFKDVTNHAFLFLICGSGVFLLAIFQCATYIWRERGRVPALAWLELALGVTFFIFGLYTHRKARDVQRKLAEENAFTLRVIEWCLSTYPPEMIDRTISDAISEEQDIDPDKNWAHLLPPSMLRMHRHDLLRTYIAREFDIDDPEYFSHLVDEAYISMFETQKLGGSASV